MTPPSEKFYDPPSSSKELAHLWLDHNVHNSNIEVERKLGNQVFGSSRNILQYSSNLMLYEVIGDFA